MEKNTNKLLSVLLALSLVLTCVPLTGLAEIELTNVSANAVDGEGTNDVSTLATSVDIRLSKVYLDTKSSDSEMVANTLYNVFDLGYGTTVLPEDLTVENLVWSSSDPTVATVDEEGFVTAKNAGTTIIKAQYTDDIYDTCEIIVEDHSMYCFEIFDDGVYLQRCSESAKGEIKIPDTILGEPVVCIYDEAFSRCSEITSIIVPENVKKIGEKVFKNCENLETVHLPSTLESMADLLGDAFINSPKLKSITVDENNAVFKSKDGVLYSSGGKTLYFYPPAKPEKEFSIKNEDVSFIRAYAFYEAENLETVILSEETTGINMSAFSGCKNLKRIEIPATLHYLGESAFARCESLENLRIDINFDTIESYTFADCKALKSITLANSGVKFLEKICSNAFYGCDALADVYFADTEDEWNKIKIITGGNESLLREETIKHFSEISLEDITLNKNYITLEEDATFALNYAITNPDVTLSDDVIWTSSNTEIATVENGVVKAVGVGNAVIKLTLEGGCRVKCDVTVTPKYQSFTYVEEADGSITITGPADRNVTGSITISAYINEKPVKKIGENAFANCTGIEKVIIRENIESIAPNAFDGCTNLTAFTNYSKAYSNSNNVLFNKSKTELVIYPAGKTDVEYTIPETVTKIDCFSSNKNIKIIRLSNTVKTIDSFAFDGCTAITYVYFDGTKAEFEEISIGEGNDPFINAQIHYSDTHIGSISGEIKSFNDADVTAELYYENSETPIKTIIVSADSEQMYCFDDLTYGTYVLRVKKENHVTRDYVIVLEQTSVQLDAELRLVGDVNGDGKLNMSDLSKINSHVKETSVLTDYELACADLDSNGKVSMSELARANAHIKETALLW